MIFIHFCCLFDSGEGITNDLPRIDICANDDIEYLSINRGLLHSPHYPYSLGTYLSCKKRLQIPHESHIRFFMLEKTIEYSHQMHIRLLTTEPNIQRTFNKNEYFETNLTSETIEFVLKTNHVGEGKFLLYFQGKINNNNNRHCYFAMINDDHVENISRICALFFLFSRFTYIGTRTDDTRIRETTRRYVSTKTNIDQTRMG